jgi:hypothetical protein
MSTIKSLFPTIDSADVRIKGSIKPASRPATAKPVQRPQEVNPSRPPTQPDITRSSQQQANNVSPKKENSVVNAYKLYAPVKKTQTAAVLGKNIDIRA